MQTIQDALQKSAFKLTRPQLFETWKIMNYTIRVYIYGTQYSVKVGESTDALPCYFDSIAAARLAILDFLHLESAPPEAG